MPDKFIQTHLCKSRAYCYRCRNDADFRRHLETQYGRWECPLNIPLNTPLDDLPPEARDQVTTIDHVKNPTQVFQHLRIVIQRLLKTAPDELFEDLSFMQHAFFKLLLGCVRGPTFCRFFEGTGRTRLRESCDQKIKEVPVYGCSLRGEVTTDECLHCTSAEPRDGTFSRRWTPDDVLLMRWNCHRCSQLRGLLNENVFEDEPEPEPLAELEEPPRPGSGPKKRRPRLHVLYALTNENFNLLSSVFGFPAFSAPVLITETTTLLSYDEIVERLRETDRLKPDDSHENERRQ